MSKDPGVNEKQPKMGPTALLPWVPVAVGRQVQWAGTVLTIAAIHPDTKELTLGGDANDVRYPATLKPGTEMRFVGQVFKIRKVVYPDNDADPMAVRVRWVRADREDAGSMMRRLMEAPRREV